MGLLSRRKYQPAEVPESKEERMQYKVQPRKEIIICFVSERLRGA